MNLNLPPEVEHALSQQANAAGQSLEAYVRHRLAELVEEDNESLTPIPDKTAWAKRFQEWVASHRIITHYVDDSRESIYAGRGE